MAGPGKSEALERGFMGARKNPGLIGHARRVRTERDEVAAHFDDALVLLQFLGNDVAEDAAFLGLK